MKAFHGDPNIKQKYMDRVMAHKAADEIIKGKYWENGKGCAVGCTIHSGNHSDYELELGIPRILARLEDRIFDNLPNELAVSWPVRFLESIQVGSDLSLVWNRFAHWLLVDPKEGVIRFSKRQKTTEAISEVGNLYLRSLDKSSAPTISEWRAAADAAAAYAAAAYAADAAYAAAAYAADAYAAADAADAADAAAAAYARTKAVIRQSEKLLELLKEAK